MKLLKEPSHVLRIIETETKLKRRKIQVKASSMQSQDTEQTTYRITWLTLMPSFTHEHFPKYNKLNIHSTIELN